MTAKKQLGQILLEAGAIDEFQLKSALGYQKQWGGRLGKVLVENRFITEDALVEAIHEQTGIEVVQLEKLKVPDYVIKLVPVDLAERNSLVPIRLEGETGKPGESIVLAMSDPTNLNVLDEVQFRTGKRARGLLAAESPISKAIRFYYHGEEGGEPAEFVPDPHKIQFGGKEIAEDEMVVVQGKLETTPQKPQETLMPEPMTPAADLQMKDPFAELESLAKGPAKGPGTPVPTAPPPSPIRPVEPEPEDAIDVDIDDVGTEYDLPEVEILEDVLEEIAAPEPEPVPEPTPQAMPEMEPALIPMETENEFGTSGVLLGSEGLAEELVGKAEPTPEPAPELQVEQEEEPVVEGEEPAVAEEEPVVEGEEPVVAEEEPAAEGKKPAALAKGSSAMEALLSRVGIGVKPCATAPEPEGKKSVETPEPELPDLGEPALLGDVERLLDRLESDEEDVEPPQIVKSSHLIAALIRLLLKRDVFTQEALLEELKKR